MAKKSKQIKLIETVLVKSGLFVDDYQPWLEYAAKDFLKELRKHKYKIVKYGKT